MTYNSMIKVNPTPWIKHFEQQASTGSSSRSFFSRHFITLPLTSQLKEKDLDDTINTVKKEPETKGVTVVSPVQQAVDQAKEEIKTEGKVEDKEKGHVIPQEKVIKSGKIQALSNIIAKRRRIVKRSGKKIIFNDIFSKEN